MPYKVANRRKPAYGDLHSPALNGRGCGVIDSYPRTRDVLEEGVIGVMP
jgi:hypothetical protein